MKNFILNLLKNDLPFDLQFFQAQKSCKQTLNSIKHWKFDWGLTLNFSSFQRNWQISPRSKVLKIDIEFWPRSKRKQTENFSKFKVSHFQSLKYQLSNFNKIKNRRTKLELSFDLEFFSSQKSFQKRQKCCSRPKIWKSYSTFFILLSFIFSEKLTWDFSVS